MSVGMIIPNTWINKKCSKPPTSKGIMFGQQQQEKIRRRIRRRKKEELRTKTKTITTTHQKISILW
jgi:isopentenyldiphosphate isomerase